MLPEPVKRQKLDKLTGLSDRSVDKFDSLDEEAFSLFIYQNKFDPSSFLNVSSCSENTSSDSSILSTVHLPIDNLFSSLITCTNNWLELILSKLHNLPKFATSSFTHVKLYVEMKENENRIKEINATFSSFNKFPSLKSKYEKEVYQLNIQWQTVLEAVTPLDPIQLSSQLISCIEADVSTVLQYLDQLEKEFPTLQNLRDSSADELAHLRLRSQDARLQTTQYSALLNDINILIENTSSKISILFQGYTSSSKSCSLDINSLGEFQRHLDSNRLLVIELENRCHSFLIYLIELNLYLEKPLMSSSSDYLEANVDNSQECSSLASVSSTEIPNADITVDSGIHGSESVNNPKDHWSDGTYDHTSPELENEMAIIQGKDSEPCSSDIWQSSPQFKRLCFSPNKSTRNEIPRRRRIRWADSLSSQRSYKTGEETSNAFEASLSKDRTTLRPSDSGCFGSDKGHDNEADIIDGEISLSKENSLSLIDQNDDSITPDWRKLADALIREINRTPFCLNCRDFQYESQRSRCKSVNSDMVNIDFCHICSRYSSNISSSEIESFDERFVETSTERRKVKQRKSAMNLMSNSYPPLGPTLLDLSTPLFSRLKRKRSLSALQNYPVETLSPATDWLLGTTHSEITTLSSSTPSQPISSGTTSREQTDDEELPSCFQSSVTKNRLYGNHSYTRAATRVERLIRRRFGLLRRRHSDSFNKKHQNSCHGMQCCNWSSLKPDSFTTPSQKPQITVDVAVNTCHFVPESSINPSLNLDHDPVLCSHSHKALPNDSVCGLDTVEEFSWDDLTSSNSSRPSKKVKQNFKKSKCKTSELENSNEFKLHQNTNDDDDDDLIEQHEAIKNRFKSSENKIMRITPRAFVQPVRNLRSSFNPSYSNFTTSGYDTNSTRTSATHSPNDLKKTHATNLGHPLYIESISTSPDIRQIDLSKHLEAYDQVIIQQTAELNELVQNRITQPSSLKALNPLKKNCLTGIFVIFFALLLFFIFQANITDYLFLIFKRIDKLKIISINYPDQVPI